MDINVNSNAFLKGTNDLKSHCNNIEYYSKVLLHNLKIAHENWDDANYHKASKIIYQVIENIKHYRSNVSEVTKKLKRLEECVEEYSNTYYRG